MRAALWRLLRCHPLHRQLLIQKPNGWRRGHMITQCIHNTRPTYSTTSNLPPSSNTPKHNDDHELNAQHVKDIKNSDRSEITESEAQSAAKIQILERALQYGITTFENLEFESNVEQIWRGEPLLVDRKIYREDFELWCILLDYQRLLFAGYGVKTIWRGLQERCDLPVEGFFATQLWDAFISTGTKDLGFLREVCKHMTQKDNPRPGFFVDVVGGLLCSPNSPSAWRFADALQKHYPVSQDQALQVFLHACSSSQGKSLEHFWNVYERLPQLRLYGHIITYLFKLERIPDLWAAHYHLISLQDLPQNFEEIKPIISLLAQGGRDLTAELEKLEQAGASFEGQARKFYAQERSRIVGMSSENLNIVASRTLGVAPSNLSDAFVARAFATSSLSFNFVLSGLRMIGLRAVGPLSVREIALDAEGPRELRRRFKELEGLQVDTGSSNYVRLLKWLVEKDRSLLLSNVLQCDQHPDVFEDRQTQERLLAQYYAKHDWPQINRTLAVLSLGVANAGRDTRAANILLQTALTAHDWSGVSRILVKMSRDGHEVAQGNIKLMYHEVLSKRTFSYAPKVNLEFDDLRFLIQLWQMALICRGKIQRNDWREPLRRLTMLGRFAELETTIMWLASWYVGDRHGKQQSLTGAVERTTWFCEYLLTQSVQSGIVFCGLMHPAISPANAALKMHGRYDISKTRPDARTRGIKLLRRLKEQYPLIFIDLGMLRETCLRFLDIVFGVRISKFSRIWRLQALNPAPVTAYIQAFNDAWGGTLFLESPIEISRLLSLRQEKIKRNLSPRIRDKLYETRQLQLTSISKPRKRYITTKQRYLRSLRGTQLFPPAKGAASVAQTAERENNVVVYRDLFNTGTEDTRLDGKTGSGSRS